MADTRIALLGTINPLLQAINQNSQGLARAQIAGAGFNQRNQALDLQRQGLDQRADIARVDQLQTDRGLGLKEDKLGLDRDKFDFERAGINADFVIRSIDALDAINDPALKEAKFQQLKAFLEKNVGGLEIPDTLTPEFAATLPDIRARAEIIRKDPKAAASKPFAARDAEGNEVFVRVDPKTGKLERVEGFTPPSKSGAGGIKPTGIVARRKEFTTLSKTFVNVRDSFGKVKKAAESGTAASDLSMIFNFMKMLDPGSVVREGEFANAQNTTGIPGRLLNTYNFIRAGNRLNPGQRAEFLASANDIFESVTQGQLLLEGEFRRLAELAEINPERIIIDFFGDLRPQTGPGQPAAPVTGQPGEPVTKQFIFNPQTGELEPKQ